ncbi:hypothetical protein GCM10010400_03520 [Streptomyces aculeolatus]
MQQRIREALQSARSTEPYPVWMTWRSLARQVYGGPIYDNKIRNVRQAADGMADVQFLRYASGRRHAGARFTPTDEERWLVSQVAKVVPATFFAVDYAGYRAPTRAEILEAFDRGSRDERIWADLGKVALLVNEFCQTSFDPPEVRWWRVALERWRDEERAALMMRLRNGLERARREKERQAVEARKVTLGPYRVDPFATVDRCPCCLQSVEAARLLQDLPQTLSG